MSNLFQEIFNLHARASAGVADADDIWNNTKIGLLIVGVVKPGSGMSTWKRLLQPSRKLSSHGRLV